MEGAAPTTPVTTPTPAAVVATPVAAEPSMFVKYPLMKPLLFAAAGLAIGYSACNYRMKKATAAKIDQQAKEIAKSFNDMLEKAIAANQTLPGFREDWNKAINVAA